MVDDRHIFRGKSSDARLRLTGRRAQPAFTLLEALVALTMFTILTVALGIALSTGLRAQAASQSREDNNGRVRAVFDALRRDIQAAYASPTSPVTEFIASGGQTGGQNGSSTSGGLLTMTTLSAYVQAQDLANSGGTQTQTALGGNTLNGSNNQQPQSDSQLVRYDLDTGTGAVTRSVVTAPNSQLLDKMQPGPANTLAIGMLSLQLSFWDTNQQSWRTDWDYEPQVQSSAQSTGTTPSTQASPSSAGSASGDTSLPGAIKVELTYIRAEGGTATVTTTIPVVTPQPPNMTGGTATTTSGAGTTGTSPGTGTTP